MNGYLWKAIYVSPSDPMLVDRSGVLTVATTDPSTQTVYLSNSLHGQFLLRVLLHELGHCAIFSFNLLPDIDSMVYPERREEAEEWICNFIADYGLSIFRSAYDILGDKAVELIPYKIERLIS